jgi:hypothetical protein
MQNMTPEQALKAGIKKEDLNTAVNIAGKDGAPQQMVINAKDCVDESNLHANIAYNLKHIDKWVNSCEPSKQKALIVSAGPSIKKYMDTIKDAQAKGDLIVCVKHSLPVLMDAGVIPDVCVVLDPRDVEGTSTHGAVRKDLFAKFDQKTVFMVASMTHPGVTDHLKKIGANIMGWHALVANIHEWFKYQVPFSIVGGSCSAIRAVSLLKFMGISDFDLIGFDCCFYDTPKDITAKLPDGRPKYFKVSVFGKEFLSTGELIALVQDVEKIIGSERLDVSINVLGDGIVKTIYDNKYKKRPTLLEYINQTR